MGECEACPVPVSSEYCCTAVAIWCFRADLPGVVSPGIADTLVEVAVCPNCCKYEPDECPGNDENPDPRVCPTFTPTYCQTLSITLDPRIIDTSSAGYSLRSALGYQPPTCRGGSSCAFQSPKCEVWARTSWTAVEYGRSVTVTHHWELAGKYHDL
jgi:hypothetical protein